MWFIRVPFAFPDLALAVEVAGGGYDGEGDAFFECRVAHGEVGVEGLFFAVETFVGGHVVGDYDEVGVGSRGEFAEKKSFWNEE